MKKEIKKHTIKVLTQYLKTLDERQEYERRATTQALKDLETPNGYIPTWTTKDGVKMNISDMETSHIKNCINLLTSKMPDHEEDEVICADFPESMDWQQNCYREPGAKHYKKKIAEFNNELIKRLI